MIKIGSIFVSSIPSQDKSVCLRIFTPTLFWQPGKRDNVLIQGYTIKDCPKELSYYVNLIKACLIFDHHLIYTGEFLYLLHEFPNFNIDSKYSSGYNEITMPTHGQLKLPRILKIEYPEPTCPFNLSSSDQLIHSGVSRWSFFSFFAPSQCFFVPYTVLVPLYSLVCIFLNPLIGQCIY